jgi:hypothetical protein
MGCNFGVKIIYYNVQKKMRELKVSTVTIVRKYSSIFPSSFYLLLLLEIFHFLENIFSCIL